MGLIQGTFMYNVIHFCQLTNMCKYVQCVNYLHKNYTNVKCKRLDALMEVTKGTVMYNMKHLYLIALPTDEGFFWLICVNV